MATKRPRSCTIAAPSELVTKTADAFMDELKKSIVDCDKVALDLGRITEIDSAGFEVLVALKNHSKLNNIELSVSKTSPVADEILELYKVTISNQSGKTDG